jgi:GSH-dependent disulfide-bond oxidoreductase
MIDLYSWATPNGHKIHILLEESGLPYKVHAIDIGKGDQFTPEFLRISPNNKIPAMVDQEGPDGKPFSLFESGAMMVYLAEKSGQFIPHNIAERYTALQWLMFQMGGVGPMLGQNHHFRIYAPEKIPYAIDRYTKEAHRLYGVIDKQLSQHAYLAGDAYTIADMATYPWLRSHEKQGIKLEEYPHLKKWYEAIDARPAVQRGVKVLTELRKEGPIDDKAREAMFGAMQYQKR